MRVLLVLCLVAFPLVGEEVLTNADVVKLVQAGLSAETIVAKIEGAPSRFDVSTDALVALTKDGVPDRVIRAMIAARTSVPAAAPKPARAPSRRFDVAVHRGTEGRCDGAELRVDQRGVRSSRCRGIDFDLAWSAIEKVCYEYGFRGTITFVTARGEHRVSTTTPAEAKKIVDVIRNSSPKLAVAECPNG